MGWRGNDLTENTRLEKGNGIGAGSLHRTYLDGTESRRMGRRREVEREERERERRVPDGGGGGIIIAGRVK